MTASSTQLVIVNPNTLIRLGAPWGMYACVYSTLRKLGEANGEFSGVTRLSKYSKKALGSLIGRQCTGRVSWQVRKIGRR